jgi:hypothetical protein
MSDEYCYEVTSNRIIENEMSELNRQRVYELTNLEGKNPC